MPEPVSAVNSPIVSARFADVVRKLLELVRAVHSSQPDDARADIGGRHDLDDSVGHSIAVGPTLIIDLLDSHSISSLSCHTGTYHTGSLVCGVSQGSDHR